MDPTNDNDAAREKVTDARDLAFAAGNDAQAALDLMPPATAVPTTPPIVIASADAFDRAIATAAPFAVITLAASFVYRAPLTVRQPVTIVSETFADRRGVRMTIDEPAPRFLGGVDLQADDTQWLGLEARHTNPLYTILQVSGARALLDRARVLGDPTLGAKRGIQYTGSAGAILNAFVEDVFQPAQDTQAIYADNMGAGGLTVDNGYFSAAGQSMMFGGGPSGSVDRVPRGIRVTHSTLTKRPAWLEKRAGSTTVSVQQVKCAIEFKNCEDVVVDDCDLEYAGISQGQGAYLAVFSPRNQNGLEPWTIVRNVRITNSRGRHASGLATFLGDDNVHPSQQLADITLTNIVAEDLDRATYGGSGWVFYINRGTKNVHLEAITASGVGLKSIVYCDEKLPPTGLVLRNFKVPTVIYPYHTVLGNSLALLQAYAPDAILDVHPGDVGATV